MAFPFYSVCNLYSQLLHYQCLQVCFFYPNFRKYVIIIHLYDLQKSSNSTPRFRTGSPLMSTQFKKTLNNCFVWCSTVLFLMSTHHWCFHSHTELLYSFSFIHHLLLQTKPNSLEQNFRI